MHSTLTCIVILIIGVIIGFILGWILAPDERSIYLNSGSEAKPSQWRTNLASRLQALKKTQDTPHPGRLPIAPAEPRLGMSPQRGEGENSEISIIINALLVKTPLKEISYDDIVSLARKKPRGARAGQVMSVTYCVRKVPGSDSERSGMMHPGCKPVRVEAGMIFNVMDTSNA